MGTRRRLSLVLALAMVAALPVITAGPAYAAATVDSIEFCVDGDGFHFAVEVTETTAPELGFRIGADDDGIGPSDLERFEVNVNVATGAVTNAPPQVRTFGTPPFDRWVDGPVADYSATPIGAGQLLFAGTLAPGADAFQVGDQVASLYIRPFTGSDVNVGPTTVTACAGLPDVVGDLTGPATAAPGENISSSIQADLTNIGDADIPGGVTVGADLVLSSDQVVPPGFAVFSPNYSEDVLLQGGRDGFSTGLNVGETKTLPTLLGTIPADTPFGSYYLCIRVDPGEQVAESDESNNVDCTPIQIGTGFTTQTLEREFHIRSVDSVPYELFSVIRPGQISVDVDWTGASNELTVQLTGKRRPALPDPTAPYAEVTGTAPLTLTYDVTNSDLARGVGWRVIVRDASGQGDADGTIEISVPFDQALDDQFQDEKVALKSGDLWPSSLLQAEFFTDLNSSPGIGRHALISMNKACNCNENKQLEEAGFFRQSFIYGRNAFGLIARGANLGDPAIAAMIRGITPLEPEDKMEPKILVGDYASYNTVVGEGDTQVNYVNNGDGTINVSVVFADDVAPGEIPPVLAAHTISFEAFTDKTWIATLDPANLGALAGDDAVEWVDAPPAPNIPDNDVTRATINADAVQIATIDGGGNITYAGITGNGITVGIHDNGVDGAHNDLNLVADFSTGTAGAHGTHVAGIATGSGAQSNQNDTNGTANGGTAFQWRGVAPNASAIDGNMETGSNLLSAIQTNSLDVYNRSQSISFDGAYDASNQTIDSHIRGGSTSGDTDIPRRPMTTSAGNHQFFPANQQPAAPPQGPGGTAVGTTQAFNGGQVGYFSVTKQMKNALVVGNWDANTGQLSGTSSLGPAQDGRIKPDVVAPGTNVFSTGAGSTNPSTLNGYRFSGGTSMAAPAAAGTYALMLEAWQTTYSDLLGTTIDDNPPLPSTLRAIVIQTAADQNTNNVTGFVNVDVDSDNNLANGNDGAGTTDSPQGPDYATGWGLINAQAAVGLVQDSRLVDGVPIPNRIIQDAINQGATLEYDFVVDTVQQVQVTLAWDDLESSPANLANNPMLVNDLDLELVAPDGTIFYPWQLGHTINDTNGNPLANNAQPPGTAIQVQVPITATAAPTYNWTVRNCPAGRCTGTEWWVGTRGTGENITNNTTQGGGAWVATTGKDHLNNVEVATIQNAQVGRWKARVIGFNVQADTQDFSLVGFPYPDLADLQVFSADKVGISAFDTDITFDFQVSNVGTADAPEVDYRILLSTDFVIDDDVELTDTSGPGTVIAIDAGNAADPITSTVQISQADADTLLGTTGATVQDLIDNDVFIIVQVDAADVVLEHNEPNAIPIQMARLTDVVLVYDRSGSMSGQILVSTGGTRPKIELLRDSARVFYDLMRLDAGDQLGSISFSGSSSIARDFALDDITSDNISVARNTVTLLVANGATDIRGALQEALDVLPDPGADARRRVVVFFSDGEATAGGDPAEAAFLSQFSTRNIRIFSVGFGTPGGSGYSGIDVGLLQTLADANNGGFFLVTERATELDKFFVNALAGAVDWETVIDPTGTLGNGESTTVDVGVTEEDSVVYFITTWDSPAANLDVSIRTPSGALLDASSFAAFGNRIERASESTHEIIQIRLPLTTGSTKEHEGSWQLIVSNDGTEVAYSASAMAETTIRGDVTVAPPPGGEYNPGDPVPFTASLRSNGGAPIGGATVTVVPEVPLVGLGDVLSLGLVSPAELAAVPTSIAGDELTLQERMIIALRNRLGTNPIPTGPASSFQLGSSGPGSYGTAFSRTRIPGPYTFTARSSFRTEECADSTRETSISVGIEAAVSAPRSPIQVTTGVPGSYIVTVVHRDSFGGYLGPGRATDVEFVTTGPIAPASPVIDNLDGSYLQLFTAGGSGTAEIAGIVLGTFLPPVLVSVGDPFGDIVLPGGGGSGSTVPIVIVPGPVGAVADVVGASLRLGSTIVPLTNVTANTGAGTVSATVPAGLDPGLYSVVLETAGGANAPTATARFRVVGEGQDYPSFINQLETSLASLGNATGDELNEALVDLLREVRAAPTGDGLTTITKQDALQSVLGAITGGGDDPVANVLRTIDLAKFDARFFSVAPVLTPIGSQVTADLGFGITASFANVTKSGVTALKVLPGPSEIDPVRRGSPHVAYDVVSTAVFGGGDITLIFPYREGDFTDETSLRILHQQGGQWSDVTAALNTTNDTITAVVSSLSPFVIVQGEGDLPDPENQPPTATDDEATTDEDVPTTIDLLDNDSDPDDNLDPGSVVIVLPPSSGAVSAPAAGVVTYTPDPNYNGADSLQYIVCDDGGLCDGATVEITVLPVNDTPNVSATPSSQTVQYSDGLAPVTIEATDVDSALTLTPASAPAGVVVDESCTANASGGEDCTWTLTGRALAAAGDYEFKVSDGEFTLLAHTLTVVTEDASVAFDDDNPVAVPVAEDGGDSGAFTIVIDVTETLPDSAATAPAAGDIELADVGVTLEPVGPGGIVNPTECTTTVNRVGAPPAYGDSLTVECSFNDVAVNTYVVTVVVDGDYYDGAAEDVLVVYDPSLGFTTGGGQFTWPGTGDKTNFGYTMKYNKKGTKVQGSLLMIRHLDDGTIYRIKSNALYGLAIGDDPEQSLGWASFSGKATYLEPGWDEPEGNHEFIVYVEDRDQPGSGVDRFWIEVLDKQGDVIPAISIDRDAVSNAVPISGGNIVVPHGDGSRGRAR